MFSSPTGTNDFIGTQERSQPDHASQGSATSSRKKHTGHKKHYRKHDTKTGHALSASTMDFPDQSDSPGNTLEDDFASFTINEDYVNYSEFQSSPTSDLGSVGAQFDVGQGGSVIGLSAATGSPSATA
ncbi:hypothetical protein AB5N19_12555 [Seiridium cardinale]